PTLFRSGGQQAVVFGKAHEGAGQQPGHGGLGDLVVAPGAEGVGGAAGFAGRFVLGLKPGFQVRQFPDLLAQVGFQLLLAALQVGQQLPCINHALFPDTAAAGAARWRFSSQGLGRWVQSAGVITGSTTPSSMGGWWLSPGSSSSRAGRCPDWAASRSACTRPSWP